MKSLKPSGSHLLWSLLFFLISGGAGAAYQEMVLQGEPPNIYRGKLDTDTHLVTGKEGQSWPKVLLPAKGFLRKKGIRFYQTFHIPKIEESDHLKLSVKLQLQGERSSTLKIVVMGEDESTLLEKKYKNWEKIFHQKFEVPVLLNQENLIKVYVSSSSPKVNLLIEQLQLSIEKGAPVQYPPVSESQGRWVPQIGMSWDIQFEDEEDIVYRPNVHIYNIDLFDTSKEFITNLKQKGHRVLCYFSVGTWEKWRPDANDFSSTLIGNSMPGWPGEKYVNVSEYEKLLTIMKKRFDLAIKKGCDGVDLDNMDTYTHNRTGFNMGRSDQIVYNRALAEEAHKRGLAVGLKNAVELVRDLVDHFDFTINEECFDYQECHLLRPFIKQGKPVFGIQYQGGPQEFCPEANRENFDFLKKGPGYDLGSKRIDCREF